MRTINMATTNLSLEKPLVPQVIQSLSSEIRTAEAVWLSGQPTAALISCALLEGIGNTTGTFRLPTIVIHGGGAESSVQKGVFDLHEWRHNRVRPQRVHIDEAAQKQAVVVLDSMGFGLAPDVHQQLATTLQIDPEGIEVMNIKLPQAADYAHPEEGVLEKLLSLPDYCWAQNTRLILLPEGWAPRAMITVSACYGLRHSWPEILRVLPLGPGKRVVYKELIDLQALRQQGADLVSQWKNTQGVLQMAVNALVHGAPYKIDGNVLVVQERQGQLKLVVSSAEEA